MGTVGNLLIGVGLAMAMSGDFIATAHAPEMGTTDLQSMPDSSAPGMGGG